jgi:2-phosphoglycolate phosphatase
MIKAVLFDLDGTFADTAPDLAGALNRLREEHGLPPIPPETMRRHTSAGARGMLGVGFGIGPQDGRFEELKSRFLGLYERHVCVETTLFPGIPELVEDLESRGMRWGIVTNKAGRFTDPLVRRLELDGRAACIVSGDTTPHLKPHPASLLHAAELLALAPSDCLYIGDDLRDVQAARAANMKVLAAAWGYLGDAEGPEHWSADAVIEHPIEVLEHLTH